MSLHAPTIGQLMAAYDSIRRLRGTPELQALLEVKDDDGDTPLMAAIRRRQTPLMAMLLALGAHVDVHNNEGLTAQLMVDLMSDRDMMILMAAWGREAP